MTLKRSRQTFSPLSPIVVLCLSALPLGPAAMGQSAAVPPVEVAEPAQPEVAQSNKVDSPASEKTDKADKAAKQRKVCKQVTPIGTRLAKKTCKSAEDWEAARRMGSEAARTGTETSRMIRDAPPGG